MPNPISSVLYDLFIYLAFFLFRTNNDVELAIYERWVFPAAIVTEVYSIMLRIEVPGL